MYMLKNSQTNPIPHVVQAIFSPRRIVYGVNTLVFFIEPSDLIRSQGW